MKKCIAKIGAALVFLAAVPAAIASGPIDFESGEWIRLAEGVYQREAPDGTTIRMGFDAGGARYDRQVLERDIEVLSNQQPWDEATVGAEARLAELKTALAGIPVVDFANGKRTPPAGIMSSQTGTLCGRWPYAFDSHLFVGKLGATVTARTGVGLDPLSPPLVPSSATQYAYAELTPSVGSNITTANTRSDLSTWMAPATSDWVKGDASSSPVASTSCSANTLSYISINAGPTCTPGGGGYVSMTKVYPSCVTTP